jgi:taurine dioxygenase
MPDTANGPIRITPCQPCLGAEIGGVDLSRPIPTAVADALRAAILKYQVIVLRDQAITREQHLAFGRLFARDPAQPFGYLANHASPIEGFPEILRVFGDGKTKTAVDVWHTDDSRMVIPADLSILRARVVPALGGDTVFSSCVAAYAGLPEEVKQRIRYLKAWHGGGYSRRGNAHSHRGLFNEARLAPDTRPDVAQPLVRIHPETGQPALYFHEIAGAISGVTPEEDERLRHLLFDQIKKPEYQMRVRWTANAITVWDNRAVQHYAVADYSEPREMERITVAGIEPCIGYADLEANPALRARFPLTV